MTRSLAFHPAPRPADARVEPTIAVLGAAPDTGNLGVQALGASLLAGLARRLPASRLVVFGSRPGRRIERLRFAGPEGRGATVAFESMGCSLSRRPLKPGNLYRERVLHRLGLGSHAGSVSRILSEAALILDLTGGDSFTTLYGDYRFRYAVYPKQLALLFDAPFVLLPQTYGPFDENARPVARAILTRSTRIWARDETSAATARALAPERPVGLCPDLALALPDPAPEDAQRPFAPRPAHAGPTIGLNVSGLLYHRSRDETAARYGLVVDYRDLARRVAAELLRTHPAARLLLVPHVVAPPRHAECDADACAAVHAALPPALRSRALLLPAPDSAIAARHWIGACDFFVGTRMHSCIAALGQGIPTCAIAYSDKTAGVFATLGVEDAVIDPRAADGRAAAIAGAIVRACRDRDDLARRLARHLPAARGTIEDLFDTLAGMAGARSQRITERRAA